MKGAFGIPFLAVLLHIPGTALAQMSAREFSELPEADQRTVLVSSLEQRQKAVRNLQARSLTHKFTVPYRDGKRGTDVLEEGSRWECELRRKDGNHWASVNWITRDDKPDAPTIKVVTTIDSQSGVARSMARHRELNGVHGAITSEVDPFIKYGRFHHWFDGNFDHSWEFPLQFLLHHAEAIKFEGVGEDNETVKISLLFEKGPADGTPYQNARTVWLDPRKGFLPVHMFVRWEYEVPPPDKFYEETEIEVLKTEKVNDVWFPTHFKESSASKLSTEEGYAVVRETTVSEIRIGTVKDADMLITFEDGTKVLDRLKGVSFVANSSTQVAAPVTPQAPAARRQWLIFANVAIVVVGMVVFAVMSRRRKPKSELAT